MTFKELFDKYPDWHDKHVEVVDLDTFEGIGLEYLHDKVTPWQREKTAIELGDVVNTSEKIEALVKLSHNLRVEK